MPKRNKQSSDSSSSEVESSQSEKRRRKEKMKKKIFVFKDSESNSEEVLNNPIKNIFNKKINQEQIEDSDQSNSQSEESSKKHFSNSKAKIIQKNFHQQSQSESQSSKEGQKKQMQQSSKKVYSEQFILSLKKEILRKQKYSESDHDDEECSDHESEKEQQQDEKQVNYELKVQGLAFEAVEKDVEDLFNKYGKIKSVKILRKVDGASKGISFITFKEKKGLERSLLLSGTEHMGRIIKITDCRKQKIQSKKEEKQEVHQQMQQKKEKEDKVIQTNTLFIGGLSPQVSEEEIRKQFQKIATVNDIRIIKDKVSGKVIRILFQSKGFGYISFEDVKTAKKAQDELNGHEIQGKKIRLNGAKPMRKKFEVKKEIKQTRTVIKGNMGNKGKGILMQKTIL